MDNKKCGHNPGFGNIEYTMGEQESIQGILQKKLGPSFVSKKEGSNGQKIAYIEPWKVTALANEIFGFNGWSHSITKETIDYVDHYNSRYYVGVSAHVKVQLKNGVFHEDMGYGISEGLQSKGLSLEKAKKEAIADALRRALKSFGNVLGNCLNSKDYLQFIARCPATKPKEILPDKLLEEFPSNLQNLRRQTLIEAKKNNLPCSSITRSNSNDLEIKIPTPPPSLICQEEDSTHFDSLQSKKTFIGGGGIPKHLPYFNGSRSHCLTPLTDSAPLTPNEFLAPLSKRRDSDSSHPDSGFLSNVSDSKDEKAQPEALTEPLSAKEPLLDLHDPLSPLNLFNDNSDSEGSFRSNSPNTFIGFSLRVNQPECSSLKDDTKSPIVKSPKQNDAKLSPKIDDKMPDQDVPNLSAANENIQEGKILPDVSIPFSDAKSTSRLRESCPLQMEDINENVECLYAQDDPELFSLIMMEALTEAKNEEREVKSFAQNLGLAPSKTHDKYETEHTTIIAPVTNLKCMKPSNLVSPPITNFRPFTRLVDFPEEEFSLMCNRAKSGNRNANKQPSQNNQKIIKSQPSLTLTDIFNNLSDESHVAHRNKNPKGKPRSNEPKVNKSRILSPGVRLPPKSLKSTLFRNNRNIRNNTLLNKIKSRSLSPAVTKKRKIEAKDK